MFYNVYTLTVKQLCELIASGDDTRDSQIRTKENGDIFISTIVGADELPGIATRFETFNAHNGYIGPHAASDPQYVQRIFDAIQVWKVHPSSYIEHW